jgi:hypothetical protein
MAVRFRAAPPELDSPGRARAINISLLRSYLSAVGATCLQSAMFGTPEPQRVGMCLVASLSCYEFFASVLSLKLAAQIGSARIAGGGPHCRCNCDRAGILKRRGFHLLSHQGQTGIVNGAAEKFETHLYRGASQFLSSRFKARSVRRKA